LKSRSQQVIAGVFTLLLLIGQFASLAHAVDHPFHQVDEHCASFIHCEKQDLSPGLDGLNFEFSALTSEKQVFSNQSVNVHSSSAYSARAPPFIS